MNSWRFPTRPERGEHPAQGAQSAPAPADERKMILSGMINPFPSSHPVIPTSSAILEFTIPSQSFCSMILTQTRTLKSPQSPSNPATPQIIFSVHLFSIPWNLWQVNPKLPHAAHVKWGIKMKEMAPFHQPNPKISLFWTDCSAELGNRMLPRMFKPPKLLSSQARNVSSTWLHWQGFASHLSHLLENSLALQQAGILKFRQNSCSIQGIIGYKAQE